MTNCPTCSGLGVATRCECCAGTGFYIVRNRRESYQAHSPELERCTVCDGKGYVPISLSLAVRLGFVYIPEDPRHAS
jgi:RecJ-like exonuclease